MSGQGGGSGLVSKAGNPFSYFHSSPEVIRLVVLMYARFPMSPHMAHFLGLDVFDQFAGDVAWAVV
ncbi:hypothetical protein [Novosphingobium malaysiense]|uniref:hypothetical protein n=1 Tax=Novosphingobium malaysiense TaxID=1348853 RepID=UPI0018CEA03C|nr:hypothetical protein [Novosphingobium malaysiense]